MAAGDVATVFLDTSLGTRLAVSFPTSSTTVADLKRIVSHEHAACFPHLGQIAVQSIKVDQGGSWFHLADSMAVRDAFRFQGINERWHLQVDASLQVDQGMATQGHSGGASSANHSAPAPGRHGYQGSSSRMRSSSETLPDHVEAEAEVNPTESEREQPLSAKGERSSNGAEKDREQGTWKRRLRHRTQVGKTTITLSSNSSSRSSSESEEMDMNTVDAPAPAPTRNAATPQFVVELKKCHFAKRSGQYLNVPRAFSKAHGYTETKKVVLRMGGKSWSVNLKHGLNSSGMARTSLRYGWHQFCVDNRLCVDETCFFRALPGGGGGDRHVHELKVEVRRLDGSYTS
ncbi:hypothetical protein ZWY2020_036294 [Hordeum vulgare]|uniref:Predicted protein n=1 Tax=Hordeum vulgare subsp. vulgare TaxID=112509 RepID=F2EIN1_HORVV|nr:hypothetical protein ZWY2020_036294 [Hordeum vulgare]BAK07203.1 predicted protein [Hordeum vulgare subsp. vulgare]